MTREEIEELKGLAASMGLYDDKKPCKRAVILGKAIKALEQEPCGYAVSRQAVEDAIAEAIVNGESLGYGVAYDILSDLPPVTPQPKEGHWEWNQYDANPKIGNFHCSLCHSIGRTYFDYCPYCGAKMSEIPTGEEGSEKND